MEGLRVLHAGLRMRNHLFDSRPMLPLVVVVCLSTVCVSAVWWHVKCSIPGG